MMTGDIEYTDKYFFAKVIATRMKQPDIISIKHRFKDDNDMAYIDDWNMKFPISINNENELAKQQASDSRKQGPHGRTIIKRD